MYGGGLSGGCLSAMYLSWVFLAAQSVSTTLCDSMFALLHTSSRVADGSAQRHGQKDGRYRTLKNEAGDGDGRYVSRHCA